MKMSIQAKVLAEYTKRQLDMFFPDRANLSAVDDFLSEALERVECCFSAVHAKYFRDDCGAVIFNHLHSDQYAMYLYFLANTIYRFGGDLRVSEKLFCLNKALNAVDAYYTISLPDIFLFSHPVGTVLGRAVYSNYFLVYQNCTVGSNHYTDYPVLGEYVAMYSGSSVLGKSKVGNNCKIATKSVLIDSNLADNTIFIGDKINPQIRECRKCDRVWGRECEN